MQENTKGTFRKLTGSVCWNVGCNEKKMEEQKGRMGSDLDGILHIMRFGLYLLGNRKPLKDF